MRSLSLSTSSLSNNYLLRINSPASHQTRAFAAINFATNNHFLLSLTIRSESRQWRREVVDLVPFVIPRPGNLQGISAISTAILMVARGTVIHKSFLVPLFVLQAPGSIILWMKGEYGMWTAFLAPLVRLFFHIPGELELPFITFLLVIVAPYQIMRLRGTQEGVILSLIILIAAYLAFLHFTRAGSLAKSFDQGSVLATIATICVVLVPCFF